MSEEYEVNQTVTVYGIVEGPFHSDDVMGWDEGDCWLVLCQVENAFGGIELEELAFYDFDDAYEVVKYFKEPHSGPFVIYEDDWDRV